MADRFPLYRSDWTESADVAQDLRVLAELVEQVGGTEWYIQPIKPDSGDFDWDGEGTPDNYVLTHL